MSSPSQQGIRNRTNKPYSPVRVGEDSAFRFRPVSPPQRRRRRRTSLPWAIGGLALLCMGVYTKFSFTLESESDFRSSELGSGPSFLRQASISSSGLSHVPRILLLYPNSFNLHQPNQPTDYSRMIVDPLLQPDPQHQPLPAPGPPPHPDDCKPREPSWMPTSFQPLTCNNIHELPLSRYMLDDEIKLSVLGEGWFRTTWKLRTASSPQPTVLKTLRIAREFLPEYYELHRRDAVAMERLSASPYVVDVYSFCGHAAVNEYANFPLLNIKSLEDFDRKLRGNVRERTMAVKLNMAHEISRAVRDLHRLHMVHYDINPRNIALFEGGKPKLNDFNIAEFQYCRGNGGTCGFPSRMHQPWWRSPEEMRNDTLLDEKVDIYSLGNLLFHLLTTHAPWGKMKTQRIPEVTSVVVNGTRPTLMEPFTSMLQNNNTVVQAFVDAMDLCFHFRPQDRGTAEQIVTILERAVEEAIVRKGINVTVA